MPTFPLPQGSLAFGQTFATTTYGTTITAAGSANVKGTPVQLIAATDHDAHWIEVMVGNPNNSGSYAVDILIGASTEAVLIPNLCGRYRQNNGANRWLFPIFVPKGSRIAAQVASDVITSTVLVGVVLFNSGMTSHYAPTNVVQYGTLSASLGVNIDPGAVAHTKAGLTQMTAATDRDHHWLALSIANTDTAWTATTKWLIDVLIGASTEATLVAHLATGGSSTTDSMLPENVFHLPIYVPKGSRLSVRAQCSITTDGDRDLFVTIHGS